MVVSYHWYPRGAFNIMEDPHRSCCVPSARINRPSLVVANDNMLVVSKSFRYGLPCKLNRGQINHQMGFCRQAIVLWCLVVETQWTLDPCCWQNQPTKYQNQFNHQQYYMRYDGAGVKWCYQANHSQYFFDELVAVKYTVVYNI